MSSEPWDVQPTALPVRGDKALFVDTSDSNNTRLTVNGLEDFSRIQNAAHLYSNLITYKLDDFVEFNNTIFQNITAVTVAEEFDPVKWREVNGASSVVHVRAISDLPDKKVESFDSFADAGTDIVDITFGSPHGYTENQTLQIATTTPSTLDDFYVISIISTTVIRIPFIGVVPSTDTGTATRCLASNTVYQLEIPYNTSLGFKQVDGAPSPITGQNTIRSSNTLINTLTLDADVFLFDADTFGSLILQDLSITVTNPFAPFGTLFALDGINIANNPFLQIKNSQVNGIKNLGSLKNLFFVNDVTSFFLYQTGLSLENVPTQSSGLSQGPFPGSTPVFSSIKNLTALPATSIFTGIQNFFQNAGPSVFDIDPATLIANRVTILDSGPATPAQYFKNGTEKRGTITAYASVTTSPIATTGATGIVGLTPTTIQTGDTTGLVDGDAVVIEGTTDYNGIHGITNLTANTSFDIIVPFVSSQTGTWVESLSPTLVTSAGHTLSNGDTVEIENSINYNQNFVISNVIASTSFEIPREFGGNDAKGNFIQLKPITAYSILDSDSGSITAFAGTVGFSPTTVTIGINSIVDGQFIVITGTTSYNGTFVVSNSTGTTVDITTPFVADDATGSWSTSNTRVTTDSTGLSVSDSILIDETVNNDGGFVIFNIAGATSFDIFKIFTVNDATGVWRDSSLSQQDLAVVLADVQNEINSFAKGSYFVNSNTEDTVFEIDDFYVDFILGISGSAAIEGSDNERWRLINDVTGEIEYRGIEPFSGSLFATMTLQKPGGGQARDYLFRGIKNGGLMFDQRETPLQLENAIVSFAFTIPITAKTNDKFKLQVKPVGFSVNIDIQSISTIIA